MGQSWVGSMESEVQHTALEPHANSWAQHMFLAHKGYYQVQMSDRIVRNIQNLLSP